MVIYQEYQLEAWRGEIHQLPGWISRIWMPDYYSAQHTPNRNQFTIEIDNESTR